VEVTGLDGQPLGAKLAVEPDVGWVGYANKQIRRDLEPLLREALSRRGLAAR
jgi:hypothetical protein